MSDSGNGNNFFDRYNKKQQSSEGDQQDNSTNDTSPGNFKPRSTFFTPHKPRIITVKEPSKINWGLWTTIAVTAVVIIVVVILLVNGGGVTVPDFEGYTVSEVSLWSSQNGIYLQKEEQYNDEVEEQKVISQDTEAGTKVKKGEFVRIFVSLGHDMSVMVELPDLMKMSKLEIESWANASFMSKVRITTEDSDTIPIGQVIRYEINDDTVIGDEVRRDTPIYVIVSKGQTLGEDVTIPDFKAMQVAEIMMFGEEKGIVIHVEEEYHEFISEGMVISQSVKAEKKVPAGSDVTVVVSLGKEIIVPNFVPMSKEIASMKAGELGINISVSERYSSVAAETLVYQTIPAGEIYTKGAIVELVYSLGNTIQLNSFIGQREEDIREWAEELNKQNANIKIQASYTISDSPSGTILKQSKTGSVSTGTSVDIIVSSGTLGFVPDFVAPEGSNYDIAVMRQYVIEKCAELSIIPIFVCESKSGRLPGEVWHQSIAPGTEVREGNSITIKYTPQDKTITIPNFYGMKESEIKEYRKKLKITVSYGDASVSGYEDKVIAQSISAGETVVYGTEIQLYLSLPTEVYG